MVALPWCIASCRGSGAGAEREEGSPLLDARGQPFTISATPGNATGDVKVAAMAEEGPWNQGKVDVKTGRGSMPAPMSKKAAVSVCSVGATKKVAFDRDGSGGGKADEHTAEQPYWVSAAAFTDRVGLGLLDLPESGDTLVVGGEAGKNSIQQFVDFDGGGTAGLDETADGGDGAPDVDDVDREDVDAWIELEDDIEDVESCDWDTDLVCKGLEVDRMEPSFADVCYFEEGEAYVPFGWEDEYISAIEAGPALAESERCARCDAFDLGVCCGFDTP